MKSAPKMHSANMGGFPICGNKGVTVTNWGEGHRRVTCKNCLRRLRRFARGGLTTCDMK